MKQVKGWWLPDTDTDFDRWILDGEYQKKQRPCKYLRQLRFFLLD